MKTALAIACAASIAVSTGCMGVDTAGITVTRGRLVVEDRDFAQNLRLDSDVVDHTPEGYLNARIRLQNTNHRDYSCQYMIEWLDAKGYVLTHSESHWMPLVMHGRETIDIDRTCTLKNANDFRLKIRPMEEPAGNGAYGRNDDDVAGDPASLGYTQKDRAMLQLVEKFLTDPDFTEIYSNATARAKSRKRSRPAIGIGSIEDNSVPGRSDFKSTGQIRKELKARLRKTKLFAIVDYQTQEVASPDNIDLQLEGDIAKDKTGDTHFHFVNMRITQPDTGEEIWQDVVKVRK